jgi:YD repeat-containing protein
MSEIRNYASGTVTNPGDDITPNATTGARTDLSTAYAYDTAGNRVSTADPRRAIEAAKGTSLAADDFIGRQTFASASN